MLENLSYSAWAATLCLLTIIGIREEKEKDRESWWLPLDVISSFTSVVALLSFKADFLQQFLGKALFPLSFLAAVEITISAYQETKDIEPEEDLTEEENRFLIISGFVIVMVVFCGALLLGMFRGLSAWTTTNAS